MRHPRVTALPLLLSIAVALTVSATLLSGLPPVSADSVAPAHCDVDSAHLALDPEERTVLNQVNAYRASYGLPAFQPSYALTQNALWKSGDMASRGYVAHDDGFRSWSQRFSDCGYSAAGAYEGENLAAGSAAGASTLQQWENSPPHNENLLLPQFTAIGIKRMQAANPADPYGWYWAMELGSAIDANLDTGLGGQ